jgi:hypothetical protein
MQSEHESRDRSALDLTLKVPLPTVILRMLHIHTSSGITKIYALQAAFISAD